MRKHGSPTLNRVPQFYPRVRAKPKEHLAAVVERAAPARPIREGLQHRLFNFLDDELFLSSVIVYLQAIAEFVSNAFVRWRGCTPYDRKSVPACVKWLVYL